MFSCIEVQMIAKQIRILFSKNGLEFADNNICHFIYDTGHLQNYLSRDMKLPTMWYVRPAKHQICLRIYTVLSEPLLVALVFYEC